MEQKKIIFDAYIKGLLAREASLFFPGDFEGDWIYKKVCLINDLMNYNGTLYGFLLANIATMIAAGDPNIDEPRLNQAWFIYQKIIDFGISDDHLATIDLHKWKSIKDIPHEVIFEGVSVE